MDTQAYFHRINYSGSAAPTLDTLRRLHHAHLLTVPFENLSIHLGEPIILDEAALFDKIVNRQRGGFCYELNGLFANLLSALGFEVTLLSAGVANAEGVFGPEFDHLALMVTIDGVRWLADVGFGDCFLLPLPLDEDVPSTDPKYRIVREGAALILQERGESRDWKSQYRFTLQPRQFSDYIPMCNYHQTSPESPFTRKRVCTLATADGRITLSGQRLIINRDGQRTEQTLPDEAACVRALGDYFGITLPHPFLKI
jgi:N-hydroxyarylamine O-acetyltransferase